MNTTMDLQKLFEDNPKVDREKVAEVIRVLRELQHYGVEGARYNLAHPFSRNLSAASGGSDRSASPLSLLRSKL